MRHDRTSALDVQAANLDVPPSLLRYPRASMIVSSNKPFSAWGEIFGDKSLPHMHALPAEEGRSRLRDWRHEHDAATLSCLQLGHRPNTRW
jgi:hypothetical protein